jgi:hypothetical protein
MKILAQKLYTRLASNVCVRGGACYIISCDQLWFRRCVRDFPRVLRAVHLLARALLVHVCMFSSVNRQAANLHACSRKQTTAAANTQLTDGGAICIQIHDRHTKSHKKSERGAKTADVRLLMKQRVRIEQHSADSITLITS